MRLPRVTTMKLRAEFARVKETGHAKAGRFLVLSTLAEPTLPHLKYGCITTRKVGKAHDRNLLRRRFRAILQKHGERLIDPRRYVVMIARHQAARASFADLETDWLIQAKRLRLLKSEPEVAP